MPEPEITLTDEQKSAVGTIRTWIDSPFVTMMSLTGPAGSGKSFLTRYIKSFLPGNTAWPGMTGKAAMRLSELAGVDTSTLHSVLYKPPFQSGKYLNFSSVKKPACQVLVVDEAGMATPKVFEDLKTWQQQGVKILYVGDGHQLPPILSYKEESVYGSDFIVFREVAGPYLSKVMRSGDGIIDIVSYIRENKQIPSQGNDSVKIAKVQYPGVSAVKDYLADPTDHALITWTNKMRMQGNALIRQKLGHVGTLPAHGEPILIRKNGQDKLNGEVVVVDAWTQGPKLSEIETMWLATADGQDILVNVQGKDQPMDGSLPDIKDWKLYHQHRNNQKLPEPLPVTYGYVYTAHLAQGSQFRRVSVYLGESDLHNPQFNKDTKLPSGEIVPFSIRMLYSSLTRAKTQATLYIG